MTPSLTVEDLRTEYLTNPLGIGAASPHLGWKIRASTRNVLQQAYQVQVTTEPDRFESLDSLAWDSGKVLSDNSTSVQYEGSTTQSGQRYYWRARVWDQHGNVSNWSETVWWEMGLLNHSEWQVDWIEVGWDEDPSAFNPSPYFRRAFELDSPAQSARLYITSHGLYEAWINGQRVGDQVFTPGYTPYDLMLQYQTYDVTPMLQQGENVVGAILGDGWYRGKLYGLGTRNVYGDRLGLLAMLVVTTELGTRVTIGTDSEWAAATGPLLKSDMKDGEIYDARLELPGWSEPGQIRGNWSAVRVAQYPRENLVASMGVPMRKKETFTPTLIQTPAGESVLDFGQNLAGIVHFRVTGPEGTTIRLRHGEALDENGNFTTAHLHAGKERDPDTAMFQQVHYTLKGNGVEEYEPHFTIHGFRYAKVVGYPGDIDPNDFYSVAIYSDMPPTGTFVCSEPLINRLHENVEWSMKSNFLDLPTDCPQRERAGWTGDAQVFTPTASFLMDTRAFMSKWLQELAMEQFPNGMVGNFVPNPYRLTRGDILTRLLSKVDGSAGWGDAATFMPWALYQSFGDVRFLEDQYASMKAWVDYVQGRAGKRPWHKSLNPGYLFDGEKVSREQYIWDSNYHWGEWLEPGEGDMLKLASGALKRMFVGAPVVATAYFAQSARILARTAELLGLSDDATHYDALAENIKAAYIAEFIAEDGRIEPDRQASYVRVLAFDLAPEDLKPAITNHLLRLIKVDNNHVGTGFLSTVFLCEVLTEQGHADVAYDLLMQTSIPSWLYAVTKGATTIWESWEGIDETGKPNLSLNHYSPGAAINFLHRKVAGIEAAEPGYKRITIHPTPGGGLTHAKATYESIYGPVVSEWKRADGRMRVDITIPANTTATIALPDAQAGKVTESGVLLAETEGVFNPVQDGANTVMEARSGTYHFEYGLP